MRNLGLVMVTGELLEKLLKPVFFGKVPEGLVILKIVPSESISYAFHIVYTSTEGNGVNLTEGAIIPMIQPADIDTIH